MRRSEHFRFPRPIWPSSDFKKACGASSQCYFRKLLIRKFFVKGKDCLKLNIALNIFGPVMNLAGVILLFCYGMPYRVRTGGAQPILMEGADQKAVETERWYEWRGIRY